MKKSKLIKNPHRLVTPDFAAHVAARREDARRALDLPGIARDSYGELLLAGKGYVEKLDKIGSALEEMNNLVDEMEADLSDALSAEEFAALYEEDEAAALALLAERQDAVARSEASAAKIDMLAESLGMDVNA